MWSVGLIVGVAVAASMVTLVAGITLAILIERRRYRRYIEQHTATATTTSDERKTSTEHNICRIEAGSDIQTGQLQTTSNTWVTLPSSETIDQGLDLAAISDEMPIVPPPTFEPSPAEKKSLRKTLRSPIRKKHGRRRLQKTRTADFNSPLSVISEQSDCNYPSPSASPSILCPAPMPTPEAMAFTEPAQCPSSDYPVQDSPTPNDQPSTSSPDKVKAFRSSNVGLRSVSMGSISSAPGDPLPPLPTMGASFTMASRHHVSTSSLISVCSSDLEALATSPGKECGTTAKTQSQALQEFDFDLSCTSALPSPTGISAHRMKTIYGATMSTRGDPETRADSDSSLFLPIGNESQSRLIEPVIRRTASSATGPAGRHSMYEHCDDLVDLSMTMNSISQADSNDPFTTHTPFLSRPVKKDIQLLQRGYLAELQRHSTSSLGSNDSSQKQRQLRKSKLLMASPQPKTQYLRALDPNKLSPRSYSPTDKLKARETEKVLDKLSRGNISPTKKSSYRNLKQQDMTQSKVDKVIDSIPSTPESKPSQHWRFDLIVPNTPKLRFPPSPLRSYNSPILPSPAYTPSNLHPQPRKSQVQGPRSPHRVTQSPRHSRLALSADDRRSRGAIIEPRKVTNPMEIRKSVAILRSMNSEVQLQNSRQGLSNYLNDTTDQAEHSDKRSSDTIRAINFSQTTPQPKRPISPDLLLLPSTVAKQEVSPSHSTRSVGTSIWEDASIRGDSPEPSLPDLPAPTHEFRDETASPSPDGTPRTRVEDYDDYEKFVKNYGKRAASNHYARSKPIGLGLRLANGNPVVPSTPASLYDESGFLKDD